MGRLTGVPGEMKESRGRILIADDEPKVIRFIEISLKLHGYDVMTLGSGEEVLSLFATIQPDLLLLDIIMPGVDGLMVLEELRRFSSIPVIAYSASELNRQKALIAGADIFVKKPFYPNDIVERINDLVQTSGTEDEHAG